MKKSYDYSKDEELSESYYFNFYDESCGVGGLIRFSNHPNKDKKGLAFAIFDRDGLYIKIDRVHSNKKQIKIGNFSVSYESDGSIMIKFSGKLHKYSHYKFPNVGSLIGRERRRVMFNLVFYPKFKKVDFSKYAKEEIVKYVGDQHVEENGVIKGEMRIGDKYYDIDTKSMRDYSYGPRRFDKIYSWFWTNMNFGGKIYSFIKLVIDGKEYTLGLKNYKNKIVELKDVDVSKKFDRGYRHNDIIISFLESNKRKKIEGEVSSHIRFPLVLNKSIFKILKLKFVSVLYVMGLTKYKLDDKECLAYSEVLVNKNEH